MTSPPNGPGQWRSEALRIVDLMNRTFGISQHVSCILLFILLIDFLASAECLQKRDSLFTLEGEEVMTAALPRWKGYDTEKEYIPPFHKAFILPRGENFKVGRFSSTTKSDPFCREMVLQHDEKR